MVDYLLMNHFRIKYENRFPEKLSFLLRHHLKKEIPIMVIGKKPFFCDNFSISNDLPLDEWYTEFYRLCQRDTLENIDENIINDDLSFIPVSIYELDPLHKVLSTIEEYPEYGKELPCGHQTIVVCYHNQYYFYDPHGYDNIISKLKRVFQNIQPLKCKSYDDNFCILHCINFMLNVWKDPNILLKELVYDGSHKRLTKICKKLF